MIDFLKIVRERKLDPVKIIAALTNDEIKKLIDGYKPERTLWIDIDNRANYVVTIEPTIKDQLPIMKLLLEVTNSVHPTDKVSTYSSHPINLRMAKDFVEQKRSIQMTGRALVTFLNEVPKHVLTKYERIGS